MSHHDLQESLAHPGDLTHLLEVQRPASPVAGANFTVTVPGGVVWRVRALTFRFTASAVVANRNFSLRVTDGTGEVAAFSSPATLPASSTNVAVCFTDNNGGQQTTQGGNAITVPIGELVIPSGYTLATVINNLDVGDTIVNPILWLETLSAQPFGVRQSIAEAYFAQLLAPYTDNLGVS